MIRSQILLSLTWGIILFGAIGLIIILYGIGNQTELHIKIISIIIGILFIIAAILGFKRVRKLKYG